MPLHSVLISLAQGLPTCATATEPDSSSAVNITSPDRIPAILDFLYEIKKRRIGIYPKANSGATATPLLGRYERFVKMAQSAARKCDLHLTLRCAPQFSSGSISTKLEVSTTSPLSPEPC